MASSTNYFVVGESENKLTFRSFSIEMIWVSVDSSIEVSYFCYPSSRIEWVFVLFQSIAMGCYFRRKNELILSSSPGASYI